MQVTRMVLDGRSLWRGAWIVALVVALLSFISFFFDGAGSAVFLIVMAFFLAMSMEPAVAWLARRVPRTLATCVVMVAVAVGLVLFVFAFGNLLTAQLQALLASVPAIAQETLNWVNKQFGTSYSALGLLTSFDLSAERIAGYVTQVAGGVLGLLGSLFGGAISAFAFVFFTFYISAGLPALRQWVGGLFPPRQQVVVLTVWELILAKVGGYVGARLVLALISGSAHSAFMLLIGMDYWLPLGIWTGVIAQFVPNVGTYLAIMLPVLVGVTSDQPSDGLWVLVFAIAYQQVENLTIEPRISARAVDVHPAVSFASALIGAQLFGVAGALLGVPVAATIMALFSIYKQRYDLSPDAEAQAAGAAGRGHNDSS